MGQMNTGLKERAGWLIFGDRTKVYKDYVVDNNQKVELLLVSGDGLGIELLERQKKLREKMEAAEVGCADRMIRR